MTTITRDLIKQLRDDMNAALVAVGKQHGVVIGVSNASFTPTNVTFKVICASGDVEAGVPASHLKAAADMKSCYLHGASVEWIGKTFQSHGHTFKVVGWLPKRTASPILATREDGKEFIFSVESVKHKFPQVQSELKPARHSLLVK